MDKKIVKLGTDPLFVGLADRECSLFINPRTGDILVDEGAGEGRVNGAVFYADKEPRFYVIPAPGGGGQLLLSYRRHLLTLGLSENLPALHEWAGSANRFLTTKQTPAAANPKPPAAPAGSSAGMVPNLDITSNEPEYQVGLSSVSSRGGGPYRAYVADPRRKTSGSLREERTLVAS